MHAPLRGHLVCFSHLRWNFVYQRPQHLLSRAAKSFDVHFVEEPEISDAFSTAALRVSPGGHGVSVVVPILPPGLSVEATIALQEQLIADYVEALKPRPLVGWYYTPMAMKFTSGLQFPVCVYDCMDELSKFKGAPRELSRMESLLLEKADLVFTGGKSLFEAKRSLHPSVHLHPSSVDAKHFLPARSGKLRAPADISALPRPRIGYFGVIDERIDLDLIAKVAAERPDWSVIMIGPVVKIDPESRPMGRNIFWLGGKDYKELPAYLAELDVGFMPFALNESTRFISPTKTPEFLAAGLPVVSTPIRDVVSSWGNAGLVEIAADYATTMAGIERAMQSARNPAWLDRVDKALAATSWDRTWSHMLQSIKRVLETSSEPRSRVKVLETEATHV